MNKRILISLASATLLSVGAVGITNNSGLTPQTVQAAKMAKTFKVKLKKNAKVFTKNGKRKGKKLLKKGHTYTAYGKKTIHGKKYYRLSKDRYIKAVNVKTISIVEASSSVNTANTASSSNTNSAAATTAKNFSVTVTKPTKVYNSKGQPTGITLKAGLKEMTYGTSIINGKKYYLIGSNHYILVSDINTDNMVNSSNTVNNSKPSDNNVIDSSNTAEHQEKPTKEEVDHLLANNNDKLGYSIYFSDEELDQIKNYLWKDIQGYRLEKGLPEYKTNNEIDDLLAKVTLSMSNMYLYEGHLNETTAGQLSEYLPTLAKNGMNVSDSFDDLNYYGHYLEGYEQPKSFNFKDRNPEHVAMQIFNSFKENKYYNSMILGHNDRLAFAGIGLYYNWEGNASTVGVAFIEVSGNSTEWINFYNVN